MNRATARRGAATLLTLTLAAAVGLTTSGAAQADPVVPTDGLVVDYDLTTRPSDGVTVPNGAGTQLGAATVRNPAGAAWSDDALVFSGGAKNSTGTWVELPDDLLAGATSGTVTTEVKIDASMKSSFHFLWNIGADNNTASYWYASMRDARTRAGLKVGTGAERFAQSAAPAYQADRWYSVTSVIDGAADTLTFYVDGVQVGQTSTGGWEPGSIADQSLNTIGRAPFPDPLLKGAVSRFRVYDRALSADEVAAVSDADAVVHRAALEEQVLRSVPDTLSLTDATVRLPDVGGTLTWSAPTEGPVRIGDDGLTATVTAPVAGEPADEVALTATAQVRGLTVTKEVTATVPPRPAADDPYGYLMVHFIEDSAGYAEKIYLDVSRGDDPEQWEPLNGGKPILASHLGTTGVRDPYLTYNPETGTYYIIATDLRVFGGDTGTAGCTGWCHWSSKGSTLLNVWESTDLVTWSDVRQFDVALDEEGRKAVELGMAWAPEATWVENYYGDGRGAFVLYWSSNVYPAGDTAHTSPTYSRVLWGATTDFTQADYAYGGTFIDNGANVIDTTIVQNEGTTYRISKDNGRGTGIYMESTTSPTWWQPDTSWNLVQQRIGAAWSGGNPGGVEGPAAFKSNTEDKWYLYVDVIPSTGYRPMVTSDLDAGWSQLDLTGFSMPPHTKHGGIISLTTAQYDAVRAGDATSAVEPDLGAVEVPVGAGEQVVRDALPATADVNLAYGRGTSTLPVDWDVADLDTAGPGEHQVRGTVRSLGANENHWTGTYGGNPASTDYRAEDKVLSSTTAVVVTATVQVADPAPDVPLQVEVAPRCLAGKAYVAVRATNTGDVPVSITLDTAYGSRTVASVAAGGNAYQSFAVRAASVDPGTVTVTGAAGAGEAQSYEESYAALTCG
ncbi:LamG-like jellyroll fold domain-containing protein [Cellulosimicrobium protaetiae]|uniref:LamG-like jellyroll fold domain-containing protein n=1 Tax=Cellulosimicrobium protaetiae TaxID=2587808 RepID=A0A6M5UL57_9MICO|nr:LamG-like jellyroll fold domain-containing protein [Cellulosimicrobium protaetiae]QJW38724.1 hypothetical protein FIC82_020275 [Cellulosimicrobium protaetiae]